jgi:hypothetical protein
MSMAPTRPGLPDSWRTAWGCQDDPLLGPEGRAFSKTRQRVRPPGRPRAPTRPGRRGRDGSPRGRRRGPSGADMLAARDRRGPHQGRRLQRLGREQGWSTGPTNSGSSRPSLSSLCYRHTRTTDEAKQLARKPMTVAALPIAGCALRPLCSGDAREQPRSHSTTDERFRSSKPVSWAWLDLNQRPHPYQVSRAQRCADRHFPRSPLSVRGGGMRSNASTGNATRWRLR